jgi:hypothetical protein
MKLFIPAIATKLVLTQPWTFHLFYERRNSAFIETLRRHYHNIKTPPNTYYGQSHDIGEFTLPVGTKLSVSRVYIRLGQKEYNSVTFLINYEVFSPKLEKDVKVKGRCWMKLDDVNKMEVDIVEEK